MNITVVVDCPECHETCGWCSWYRKNAREVGCGLRVNSGMGTKRGANLCRWGEDAKGKPCTTCGGKEKVIASTRYFPLPDAPQPAAEKEQ